MKSYTIRDIPDDQYKALRIKAAEKETSINKTILEAISLYLGKQCPLYTDYKKSCQALKHHKNELERSKNE